MSDQILRDHLVKLLRGGSAHLGFDEAIEGLPADLRGTKHQELPHTAWQLLEHLRIAQWDILDFSRNPDYAALKWPDDYWPQTAAPPDAAAWDRSVEQFRRDRRRCRTSWPTRKPTSTRRSPGAKGRRSSARQCLSRITTRIT
jgi:hypothetical protein